MTRAVLLVLLLASAAQAATPGQQARMVAAARACVGDVYDADYHAGGPPPKGRGACTDVLYAALKAVGIDLQDAVDRDVRRATYPSVRDRNIDYRWAPNLQVWFRRHARTLKNDRDFQPGDLVFWTWSDGVPDHCGVISDRRAPCGRPLVIHNLGPRCTEDDALTRWRMVGHFRVK